MTTQVKLTSASTATQNLVGIVENDSGQWFNKVSSAFETYTAANSAAYGAISFVQVGGTCEYLGAPPTGMPAGKYRIVAFLMAGASLATTDTVATNYAGSTELEWKGTGELSNAADINVNVLGTPAAVWTQTTRTITGGTAAASNLPADYLSSTEQTQLAAAAASGGGATPSAVATAVWGATTRTLTSTEFLSSAEQTSLTTIQTTGTANNQLLQAIQGSEVTNAAAIANVLTALGAEAGQVIALMKSDSVLAGTFNRTKGDYSFSGSAAAGGTLTLLNDDGSVYKVLTVTASGGVIESRMG